MPNFLVYTSIEALTRWVFLQNPDLFTYESWKDSVLIALTKLRKLSSSITFHLLFLAVPLIPRRLLVLVEERSV